MVAKTQPAVPGYAYNAWFSVYATNFTCDAAQAKYVYNACAFFFTIWPFLELRMTSILPSIYSYDTTSMSATTFGILPSLTQVTNNANTAFYSYAASQNLSDSTVISEMSMGVSVYDATPIITVMISQTGTYTLLPAPPRCNYDGLHLYYYGLRYYSAEMGRWLSRDPIKTKASLRRDAGSLYLFVLNSPLFTIDALGLDPVSACDTEGATGTGDPYTVIAKSGACAVGCACQCSIATQHWIKKYTCHYVHQSSPVDTYYWMWIHTGDNMTSSGAVAGFSYSPCASQSECNTFCQ